MSQEHNYNMNQSENVYDEFEKLNGVELLTPNEVFDNIQIFDSSM